MATTSFWWPLHPPSGSYVILVLPTSSRWLQHHSKFHISRSFCQAAKLHYADLANHHDNLPSPISSGGHKLDRGTLVPIMMTTEPMPNSIVEDITCNCKTMCDTKKCSCRVDGYKCSLLCHKNLKYDHSNCMNWSEN